MILFIIFLLIFIVLFIFPFLLSKGIEYDSGMEKSLIVKNDNVKDARYFSNSFRQLMKNIKKSQALENGQNIVENAKLSKDEKIFFWNGKESLGDKVSNICYINDDVVFNSKIFFEKEVFAKGDIEFAEKTTLRAVAGENSVIIGENSKILRWADGKRFTVLKKGSNAGKSISSGERLVIEPNCNFTRLYAPVIEVKNYVRVSDANTDEIVINKDAPVYMKSKRNIRNIDKNQELKCTVITKYDLSVGAGAVVYGDIKSDKIIHIKNNAVVTGNVFSDESIIIEQGAKILGNVFAGENLYIGPDVTIGKIGRIKSAISRVDMVISEGVTIYGYAGCENKGKIVEKESFSSEVQLLENIKINDKNSEKNKKADLFEYIKCNVSEGGFLNLNNLEEYEQIDYYAFRDADTITKVELPGGATEVKESMFYGCDNLETVIIPDSVEKIEDYAFYDCKKLKNVVLGDNSRLREIGDYSFANCDSLNKEVFSNIENIGYAAFWKLGKFKEEG